MKTLKEKEIEYKKMVKERQLCNLCQACNGKMIHNPSRIEGGEYDKHGHLDPWAAWKGDLDSKIVVVGQDWNSKDKFIEQKGVVDPDNPTNKNLIELLESIGVDPQKDKLFFTNSVLCMKDGNASDPLEKPWIENCSKKFLRRTLDLIKPKIVITLGNVALEAVKKAYNIRKTIKLKKEVENEEPIYITENMKWFPVYHCGQYAVNQMGGLDEHKKHWKRISRHLP